MDDQLVDAVAVEVGAGQPGDAGAARVRIRFAGPGVGDFRDVPLEDAARASLAVDGRRILVQLFEIVDANGFRGAGGHDLRMTAVLLQVRGAIPPDVVGASPWDTRVHRIGLGTIVLCPGVRLVVSNALASAKKPGDLASDVCNCN